MKKRRKRKNSLINMILTMIGMSFRKNLKIGILMIVGRKYFTMKKTEKFF